MMEIYEVIRERIYIGDDVFEVGSRRYEPISLFGIITCLIGGKELIFGEYGSGKTTSSERIVSLIYGLPLEFVQSTTLHSHPEQTEEKIKATLDLGELEKGREVVRWKARAFSPAIVIDEINRLPVGKQNMILDEVDRNIWSYRGETIIFEFPKAIFATVNYADLGTNEIVPPLLDRFDIALETFSVHPLRRRIIRQGIDDSFLRDPKLSEEILNYISENNLTEKHKEVVRYLIEVSDEFKGVLEGRLRDLGYRIEIPRYEELEGIRREIEGIEVDDDVELFLDFLGEEVRCQFGRKDFSRCDGCHYVNYICSDISHISHRAEISLIKYAKALAWIENSSVNLEHIKSLLPYVLFHRVDVNLKKIEEVREEEKNCSDEIYALKEVVLKAFKNWLEHKLYQISAYSLIAKGDFENLRRFVERFNHPFFKHVCE